MDYPGRPVGPGFSDGNVVLAIQKQLNAVGVQRIENGEFKPIGEDRDFGPETENAVMAFQARGVDSEGRALDIDGVVGPLTWAALFLKDIPKEGPAAGGLAARTIAYAGTQIGVREQPRGSNKGPEVTPILASVGLGPGNSWCAAFVYWCFNHAIDPGETNPVPKTGGVHEMWRQAGVKGLYRLTPRQAKGSPQLVKPGMAFFLDTGGGHGHVGLIAAVSGTILTTIEGNSNEGGSREGIGVFKRTARTVPQINLGFADFTRRAG